MIFHTYYCLLSSINKTKFIDIKSDSRTEQKDLHINGNLEVIYYKSSSDIPFRSMCDGSVSHLLSADIHIYASLCLARLIDTHACLVEKKNMIIYMRIVGVIMMNI